MATQIIKTVFQFRRGTTAEWLANKDTRPAAGEPCFDLELNTLRIGNGVDTYENLVPINGVQFKAENGSLVLEDNTLKLMGFDGAEVGAQPRKNAEGKLEWVVPSTETVDGLKTTVAGLQSDVTTLQSTVSEIKEIVTPSEEGASTLLERIEGLEKEMDTFVTGMNDDDKVNTLMELIEYVGTHGKEAADMAADITALQKLVGDTSVSDQILAGVSGKVDKVEGKELSSNDFTDSLLAKLTAIEENAQANVIEKISVGGSIIDIVDKLADIPVASLDRAGVVKSSTGANKVNVSKSGEMSVNKISVHSVFVPIGDELVLDGGSADKDAPVYTVRIGNMGCNSISDAVAAADNGDVVTLQEDVNMGSGDNDHLVVAAENVTIDLGGKALTANGSNGAVKVEGGVTTLEGAGTVQGTLGSDKYSMAVWAESGTVVINDGIYKNETDGSARGTDLIYASGTGCIEINGGVFEAAKPEWTLNVKDADYKAGTAKIIVKGGKFKGFDPANNNAEGAGTSFVAEGYKSVQEGEYYVVKPI